MIPHHLMGANPKRVFEVKGDSITPFESLSGGEN